MKNKFKKGLVLGVICLMILTSVPMVSGDNIELISERVLVDEKHTSASNGSLLDNCLIKAHGSYPIEIFFTLLGDDINLFHTLIVNNNNIPITLKRNVTIVATRENRILDEFNDDFPFKLKPGYAVSTLYLDQFWFLEYYDFKFGRFDFIWDIYIPEGDESLKLVFHCFFYYIGIIVFNPKGEVIE